MKRYVSNFVKEKELLTIGESTFRSSIGLPLQLTYTSLIICTKGNAVVSVNFKNYLLKANDVLVLAEDYVTIIQRASNDFNAFYCLVDKTLAAEIAYDLPNQLFLYLNKYPFARPRGLEISLLYGWIDALKNIKNSCTPHQHIMYRNHLQNFFLKMAATVSFENLNLEKQYSRKEMLSWNFWELIGKYSNKERNVAFYAEKLHITPYYLSQITKDFLNDSPKGLIDRQVVLEIKTLLRTTEKSIKEIAEILNFEDTSYLARYFKRQTGITLTAYRK
ncbi:AraC family transcriptional regulator [Flavobacterium sp. xlx-214]|uniref:helix-turn-helix domain-containing protein n=1 Tax=unclassified Flavobacterium TaxID=196869 RepID=UPI0013D76CDC|nr:MULTISPECIES: helix-turn-helix domain-containing protein [unclassified Flavobacterium]MBA5791512.1 AraC family transcriptional regulator [Flavobacterium sp. xlx-221]QMI83338.1 AraC family transcriptional regulator [Flavobacterium sp. xlx-214]